MFIYLFIYHLFVLFTEHEKQKLHLAEKLKRNREEKQRKLAEKQASEKDNFLKKSDKATDSKDLLEVGVFCVTVLLFLHHLYIVT